MSKQEPADQVKFLVSCIGHTSNGRPDFQSVADELGIVSKAAAQKRYERMLKAHGISRPGALADSAASAPVTPSKRKTKAEGAGSAKKRTPRGTAKKEESDDEDDFKPKAAAKKGKVKKEEEAEATGESRGSSLSDPPASDEADSQD
ncbi:hypothetical protein NW762_009690 [Fusarium torreyae]|uniref:Myb-like DNA-binding domain-containing protein n=1 Tax=Fusarium torreyae TaxID=1237075 RepID=A0A9W8RUT7_9HYPO|nr:hypothetical protein NW762_009690 [Fusarium torreyae]